MELVKDYEIGNFQISVFDDGSALLTRMVGRGGVECFSTEQGAIDKANKAARITVFLRSVDGFSKSRKFKTLDGARKFAQAYAGKTPELGGGYAISADGVCRIMVSGAKLSELFPES